jgi:hypothetical protein
MLQFVVLLAIMGLWALTSLLSREAQPLPSRQIRGSGPKGTRLSGPPGRGEPSAPPRNFGTTERPTSLSVERAVERRWGDVGPPSRTVTGRAPAIDDGIVILNADARSALAAGGASPSLPGNAARRTTPARRGSRGRPSPGASPVKPPDPARPRALTSLVTQSMAQKRNRPLEITPLSAPLSPINAPVTQISTGAKIEHPGSPDSPPAFTSEALRAMLANSTKLREVALLTELLQPPLALRHGRRRR